MGQMHQEVTAEYVRRLLKGELKLKDRALQLKACQVVTEDAEDLHQLFASMVRTQSNGKKQREKATRRRTTNEAGCF